jgi:hypothetical protein
MSQTLGSPDINDTQDVMLHVPPGRKRAPFLRYIRFNLPRLTKAVILLVMAGIGGCVAYIATRDHQIFVGDNLALWLIVIAAAIFVVLGLLTKWRIWDFGMVPALGGLLVYLGGLVGNAPFVWNGADTYTAAVWNLMMLFGLIYVVLRWALGYGMLVAYPDDQGFED